VVRISFTRQRGVPAAALQAASGSDRLILLRTDRNSGHGQGSSLATRIDEQADELPFLFDQLGMHWSARTQANGGVAQTQAD